MKVLLTESQLTMVLKEEAVLSAPLPGSLHVNSKFSKKRCLSGQKCCQNTATADCRESDVYKWLLENVHNKAAYGNIKNWTRSRSDPPDPLATGGEPWHWSYDGG